MSDSSTPTPAPAPETTALYVNRTKVTQIVYVKGQWDKRVVPPGHTVELTEAEYKRFFNLFKPLDLPSAA